MWPVRERGPRAREMRSYSQLLTYYHYATYYLLTYLLFTYYLLTIYLLFTYYLLTTTSGQLKMACRVHRPGSELRA